MISTNFEYDGQRSDLIGVLLVRTETGLIGQTYLYEKEIISETVFKQPLPYVYGFQDKPFTINIKLTLANNQPWTTDKKREVARWLDVNRFARFISADNPDIFYYLCLKDASKLYNNSTDYGYIDVTFQSISPYKYSGNLEQIHDLSTIGSTPTVITILNNGDNNIYPYVYIQKVGNSDFEIRNLSNSGLSFKFTGLLNGEELYIDNEERHIETNITGTYRYNSFSGNYLELVYGNNRIECTGSAIIKFVYRYTFRGA